MDCPPKIVADFNNGGPCGEVAVSGGSTVMIIA